MSTSTLHIFPFLQVRPCVRRKQLRAGLRLSCSSFIYTITYFCLPLSVFPFSGWSGWWRCYGRKWALAVSGKSSDRLAAGWPEQTATSGDQAVAFNSEQTAEAWPGQTQAGSGILSLSPVLIPAQAQKRHRKCLTTFSLQSPMSPLPPHSICCSKGFLSFALSSPLGQFLLTLWR